MHQVPTRPIALASKTSCSNACRMRKLIGLAICQGKVHAQKQVSSQNPYSSPDAPRPTLRLIDIRLKKSERQAYSSSGCCTPDTASSSTPFTNIGSCITTSLCTWDKIRSAQNSQSTVLLAITTAHVCSLTFKLCQYARSVAMDKLLCRIFAITYEMKCQRGH